MGEKAQILGAPKDMWALTVAAAMAGDTIKIKTKKNPIKKSHRITICSAKCIRKCLATKVAVVGGPGPGVVALLSTISIETKHEGVAPPTNDEQRDNSVIDATSNLWNVMRIGNHLMVNDLTLRRR